MSEYLSFETKRLRPVPTSVNDAEFVLELVNTPKWLKYIGDRGIKTIVEAECFIDEKITPQLEKLEYANYTVVRKSIIQRWVFVDCIIEKNIKEWISVSVFT